MTLTHEVRTAARGLARTPGFFAFATLLLTVGIGLTLYVFGAVNGFILRPLPYRDADRLAHIELSDAEQGIQSMEVPLPDFFALREEMRSVEDLAAFYSATVNLGGAGTPERLEGEFVTVDLFAVLGVRPAIGRGFTAADEPAGSPPVAILAHELWQRRFGGDPGILGRTVRLNTEPTTIVGVMPPGFDFPQEQEIWLALRADRATVSRDQSNTAEVIGHLARGSTFDTARAEADAVLTRLAAEDSSRPATLGAIVQPLAHEFVNERTRLTLSLMFVAVALVLLIACADVANLLIVRGLGRQRDVAVRSALGASRRQLVARGLVEGLVVASIASVSGLALGEWSGRKTMELLRASAGADIASWIEFRIDGRTIGFTVAIAAIATLLAALGPAIAGSRPSVLADLRGSGRGTQRGRLGRASRTLVIAQIALSVALLACAGLAVRSVQNLASIDVGVDADHVLGARVGLFEGNYPDDASRLQFYRRVEDKLRTLPGVVGATVTSSLPASFSGGLPLEVEGVPTEDFGGRRAHVVRVAPSYFSTLDLPILAGRSLAASDDADREAVAVINRSLATHFFGDRDPVGSEIRFASRGEPRPWIRVVGVVPDVIQDEVDEGIQPVFYTPLAQEVPRFAFLTVRTAGDPTSLVPAIAKTVAEIDPDQPVYWTRTVADWVEIGQFMNSFLATLFTLFALAGLLLAGAGLYGVLAFTVTSRTAEIGVRRALGAPDRGIVSSIARGSLLDLAIGLTIGGVFAAALARPLSGLFYGVESFDAGAWTSIPLVLGVATLLAALVPTLRALRIEPAVALRDE